MKKSTVIWAVVIGGALVLGYLYVQQNGTFGSGTSQ
jgi:hypothetical protein